MVIGLGYPAIPSRFKDPDDPLNSYWKPSSVPSVRGKAQSWRANYRNGACGIRKLGGMLLLLMLESFVLGGVFVLCMESSMYGVF